MLSFFEFDMLIGLMYSEHVVRSRFARMTVASGFGMKQEDVALFITCVQTLLSSALSEVDSFKLRIRFLLVLISSLRVAFPLHEYAMT